MISSYVTSVKKKKSGILSGDDQKIAVFILKALQGWLLWMYLQLSVENRKYLYVYFYYVFFSAFNSNYGV